MSFIKVINCIRRTDFAWPVKSAKKGCFGFLQGNLFY